MSNSFFIFLVCLCRYMPGVFTPTFARREGRGFSATDIITFSQGKDYARKLRINFTFTMILPGYHEFFLSRSCFRYDLDFSFLGQLF